MSKYSFEYIDAHYSILKNLCPQPEDFEEAWKNFLDSSGWSEEEYESKITELMFQAK